MATKEQTGSYVPFTGTIVLIPEQVFTWDATGNIALTKDSPDTLRKLAVYLEKDK